MPEPVLHSAGPRGLYVRTFGCQMNEYDSLRVQRLLANLGYVPVNDIDQADVIFLNTCSVRGKAEHKVHSFLGSLRRLKDTKPHLKIIAGGCVAQQLGEKLLDRFDHLDMVIGTRAVNSVGQMLQQVQESGGRLACLPDEESGAPDFDGRKIMPHRGITAPVTIMQGCNNYCAYCIVPYVRGPERSRRADEILEEIRLLDESGVREVLLLGQNVNSYGKGLDENITFVDLLRRIGMETAIARIRFTTSHPKDLTDELMCCFAEVDSLCKHLHLPVQAGSDRVLARMNRGYTAAGYLEKIKRLRQICPEIALTSDIIVGFPGETEQDFKKTMQLLDEVRFDNLFSFRYSDRPNTRAATFADKVDPEVAARRLLELQSYQADITLDKNLAEVGSMRLVLVEGPSRASNGQMTGRTTQNRIVNFQAPLSSIGQIVGVKIAFAYSNSLRGDIIPA
ncbi:MAG: tRNA (N6-isopentenyl adenosine(37)-C2)-methylthiotransferase MiaB [Syntrophobacteraceae bacterium]|jgi:tRNA-2-methylthio-N6-dimethylallyladenosine synthase